MFETLEDRRMMSATLVTTTQTYDGQSKLDTTKIQTLSATYDQAPTTTTSTILKQQSDANASIIQKI